MITTHKNYKLVRGDTLKFGFMVSDLNGNPEYIDGATLSCKKNIHDDEPVFQKFLGKGISLVDAGVYNVRISPKDTKDLDVQKYYYDLEIVVGSDVYTIVIGEIDLLQDITGEDDREPDDDEDDDDDDDDDDPIFRIYVDPTLTQSGQAADAKIVGDEISNLKRILDVDPTTEDTVVYASWLKGSGTNSYKSINALAASGDMSVAEGVNTTSGGMMSHAEGAVTTANGLASHAEGSGTVASGQAAHSEGLNTTASEAFSHAEGAGSTASGIAAHSEGANTVASGLNSHAECGTTTASGNQSHSEGNHTLASGSGSHAEGIYTIASGSATHVFGRYNDDLNYQANPVNYGTYVEIVGNGSGENSRSNARTLDWDGNEKLSGSLTLGSGTANEETLSAIDLGNIKDQIDGIYTASATDVGKMLMAKTVSNGKVTEWEFSNVDSSVIEQSTSDWLDEHVQQGYAVDNTLSITGAAADAKKTGDEITDLKNTLTQVKNLEPTTVLSGTYSGTQMLTVNTSLEAGEYIIDVASVVSSDTDSNICIIVFSYNSGNTSVHFERGNNIQQRVVLANDVVQMMLYASDTYSHSAGDSFAFTGLEIKKIYPIIESIDSLKSEILPITDGTFKNTYLGVTMDIAPGVIRLDGTATGAIYTKLSADMGANTVPADVSKWSSFITLIPGHTYRAVMKLISGSGTIASSSRFTAYKLGANSTDSTHVTLSRNESDELIAQITADSSYYEVNIVFYVSTNSSFSNAVYSLCFYDITENQDEIRQVCMSNKKYAPTNTFQSLEMFETRLSSITIKNSPNIIRLNGTASGQLYVKASGLFAVTQTGSGVRAWDSYISLIPGHIYKAVLELISGSATISSNSKFTAYKVGESATDATHVVQSRDGSAKFTVDIVADASFTDINLAMYLLSGDSFTNAMYSVSVYDMTEMNYPFLINQYGGMLVSNAVNANAPIWSQWNARLAFGMNTLTAKIPAIVDGQLYANGTIISHNTENKDNNRWGFHVYEAYASDDYSRMTMLLDKHKNEFDGKPSLEFYYYTGASHQASAYGNTKIGSDVKYHSFLFNRDKMTAAGEIDCKFPITLARISPSTLDDTYDTVADADAAYEPENNATQNSSCLKYISLKNAENGAMFYDTERHKVVCKINGTWCDLEYTDASQYYDF